MEPTSVTTGELLRLLAYDIRLRILALLMRTRDLCVCELVAVLRLPQYRISRHLGQLRRTGFLTARREGPFVFYGLTEKARRDRLYAPMLRAVLRLAGSEAAAQDLSRMKRLMRLEKQELVDAYPVSAATRAIRGRPILRLMGRG